MNGVYPSDWRIRLVIFGILGCFLGILGRLYYLHVLDRERLVSMIERSRIDVKILPARRGAIYDTRGSVLAATRSTVELGIDPQWMDPLDTTKIPSLADITGVPTAELRLQFERARGDKQLKRSDKDVKVRWRKVAEGIDEERYKEVLKLGISGLYGNRKYQRFYPGKQLAAHVVGFVNWEGLATIGLEKQMDFYLRGQDGWRETERDGRRRELPHLRSREVFPRDGLNLETTIDSFVQHIVEEEIGILVKTYSPNAVTIVVSEPPTGRIVAMANTPTYDLNRFWKYPIGSHRNRALTDIFEPGSTFKIVAASGVLNEGIVDPDTRFDCSIDAVRFQGKMVQLPVDDHPFDFLTVREIVSKSSNRGAAQLGMLLGEKGLRRYASSFGFGEETNIRLGGEVRGLLHPVSDWDGLTISRLPIGHAVGVTVLQMHFAMSVIANGGILMVPQLLRRVFDEAGNTVVRYEPKARRRVISEATAWTMGEVLQKAVSPEGTASKAAIKGYDVAGKTGTARKIINGRYSHKHHIASFIGFFPARNPRFLISVIIDEPEIRGVPYGGRIAAPSFKSLAESLIRYYGIKPATRTKELYVWKGATD